MKFLLRKGRVAINCAIQIFYQKWFKKIVVICIARRQNQKNLIDSYNLSAHLLDDLGFDRNGKPKQWTTFTKPTCMSHGAHLVKAKRTDIYAIDRADKHLEFKSRK
ncbi:MAG: hypothetical protein OCC45_03895 [Desulfotalea sp.]